MVDKLLKGYKSTSMKSTKDECGFHYIKAKFIQSSYKLKINKC